MLGTLQVALLPSLAQSGPAVCHKKIEMWTGFLQRWTQIDDNISHWLWSSGVTKEKQS
jgi:hypothetical protein